MNLNDEQSRIDAHAFVVLHFDGDYDRAVGFLTGLNSMNKKAYKTLYSRRYGFIDYQGAMA